MNKKLLEVFEILEQTYYKIIKIHLNNNSYEVIKVLENENDLYYNLAEWCEYFIQDGYVFEEDVADFRLFFADIKPYATLYYRRKVNSVWQWAFLETFPDPKSTTDDPTLYLYIRNSDNEYINKLAHQKELEYKILHDSLTGLKNRTAYDDLFFSTEPHTKIGIIYSDLNKLKFYNDTCGHAAGDDYLKLFSDCLREVFRPEDCYRIGGDEFVIVLENIEFTVMQEKIIKLYDLLNKRNVSSAIGYSWDENATTKDFDFLVKEAEAKMYKNKRGR